ncbi:MAG: O-methyltransferase [Pseudomonadales bacterium]
MLKVTPAVVRFGLREAGRFINDKLRKQPSRPLQVLEYIRDTTDRGDAQGVLQAMDEFARKRRFLMNIGDEKGLILIQALKDSAAKQVLELGAYCGYSAVLMAQQLGAEGHLDSVEINAEYADATRTIVEHAGLGDKVTVHTGAAADIVPKLGKQYHLVFIDHWKDKYLSDLKVIEQADALRSGSYVVADNIGMFDASEYLDYVRHGGRYQSSNHPAHMEYYESVADAVEISIYQ